MTPKGCLEDGAASHRGDIGGLPDEQMNTMMSTLKHRGRIPIIRLTWDEFCRNASRVEDVVVVIHVERTSAGVGAAAVASGRMSEAGIIRRVGVWYDHRSSSGWNNFAPTTTII